MRRIVIASLLLFVQLLCIGHGVWAGPLEILKNRVNIRKEPNANSAILVRLNKGQMLEELQKKGKWYEIRTVGVTEITGWVFETMVGPVKVALDDDASVVARMGSVTLSVGEMEEFINLLDNGSQKKLRENPEVLTRVIKEEIIRKMVVKQAHESGFHQEPQIVKLMERARLQALADHFLSDQSKVAEAFPSDEEIIAFYQANLPKYTTPAMLNVAQIFLALPFGADKEEEEKNVEKAMELAKKARQNGVDFATIAREHSEHQPTAKLGGDLGWLQKESLQPEVGQVLAKMDPGEISNPVRSTKGWHIFKLVEKKDVVVRSLNETAEEIREILRRNEAVKNRELYLQQLIAKEQITVDDNELLEMTGESKRY